MDLTSLGLRIRQQRKLLGLTQDQLAARAGVSLSFLGHIERGTRKTGLPTLIKLANTLNISLDVLLQDSLNPQIGEEQVRARELLGEMARLLQENASLWDWGANPMAADRLLG